jgi:hypothetical protein
MTSKKIKGQDLALHLAQHPEPGEEFDDQDNPLSMLFILKIKISLYLIILGIQIWCIICSIGGAQTSWILIREGDSTLKLLSIIF